MNESWRMRMGMPTTMSSSSAAAVADKSNLPRRRRSTEDITHRQSSEGSIMEPEDFKDVFGGPPRTVMSRQFSTSTDNDYFPRYSFYEEIFRPIDEINQNSGHDFSVRSGRNLPEFRIPAGRKSNRFEGFYGDIFGWNEEEVKRSRTRSKTSSSSVLSSEDLSPLRPAIGGGNLGDGDVSLFASKLRPINVPRRCNLVNREIHEEEHQKQEAIPSYSSNSPSHSMEYDYIDNLRNNSNYGFCQRNPSPETISIDQPNSYGSFKATLDDLELNSPSSVVSSLCQIQDQEAMTFRTDQNDQMIQEDGTELEEEEDEVMSSYVIEISGEHSRDGVNEAIGVDEAIAWAKEKFQTHCSVENANADQFSDGQKLDGNVSATAQEDEEGDHWINAEEKQQMDTKRMEMEMEMEMELFEEKIRLWSTGKEADIRLLLSTLHHILWEDSGWLAVPLTNIIESSQVKKAYQKARLLLHPDKLQQRGATFLQKYVAKKAFPILQDAWAAFISQDVF